MEAIAVLLVCNAQQRLGKSAFVVKTHPAFFHHAGRRPVLVGAARYKIPHTTRSAIVQYALQKLGGKALPPVLAFNGITQPPAWSAAPRSKAAGANDCTALFHHGHPQLPFLCTSRFFIPPADCRRLFQAAHRVGHIPFIFRALPNIPDRCRIGLCYWPEKHTLRFNFLWHLRPFFLLSVLPPAAPALAGTRPALPGRRFRKSLPPPVGVPAPAPGPLRYKIWSTGPPA